VSFDRPLWEATDRRSGHRRNLVSEADVFYVAVARMVNSDGAGKAPFTVGGRSQ
jgi:hypothetical protein